MVFDFLGTAFTSTLTQTALGPDRHAKEPYGTCTFFGGRLNLFGKY